MSSLKEKLDWLVLIFLVLGVVASSMFGLYYVVDFHQTTQEIQQREAAEAQIINEAGARR